MISTVPYRTWIELDAHALRRNLAQLCALIGGRCALGVVLKSNAYGHGLEQMMPVLLEEESPVAWLCTAGVAEALYLKQLVRNILGSMSGLPVNVPHILAMAYLDGDLSAALEEGIVCGVSDYSELALLQRQAVAVGRPAFIHLKVDSGMNRRGFQLSQLAELLAVLPSRYPALVVIGIYSHAADTSNPDKGATELPCMRFFEGARAVEQQVQRPLVKHMIASGSLWYEPRGDMVRIGTLLYGIWKSPLHRERLERHIIVDPVLTWKTHIIQLKSVPAGSYIGYDRSFYARRAMRIAIVPVGYADGYQRRLSNSGMVQVRDHAVPIVGIISMNLMTIDVTDLPQVELFDCVIILGGTGGASVVQQAARVQTNPLELVAAIDSRIPRILVERYSEGAEQ